MNSSTDKNNISSLLFQLLSDQSPEEKCSTNLLKSVIKSRKKTNNNDQADDDKEINGQDKKKTYAKFTSAEDAQLKKIVSFLGPKNWTTVASFMPNKTSRQCRDRYVNYLAPGFIHSNWTEEEDSILAKKYEEFGPHWSRIQNFLPHRTSNSIKNRYNYTISKKPELNSTFSISQQINMPEQVKEINPIFTLNDINDFENDFQNPLIPDFELNDNEYNFSNEDFEIY